jgi:hypothetical protein
MRFAIGAKRTASSISSIVGSERRLAQQSGRPPGREKFERKEPNFTCTRCGKRGAEVRPKFSQAAMGTG